MSEAPAARNPADPTLARNARSRPARPRRPFAVEVAAAILVIGSVLSILTSIDVAMRFAERGEPIDALALVSVGVGAVLAVLGVLVRYGRAWLVTVNVVAVVAFLELTSGSLAGLFFGVPDVFVLLALFWERPWFQWRPDAAAGEVSP
jgi:hypothetical protein